jgi:hypothetical protein
MSGKPRSYRETQAILRWKRHTWMMEKESTNLHFALKAIRRLYGASFESMRLERPLKCLLYTSQNRKHTDDASTGQSRWPSAVKVDFWVFRVLVDSLTLNTRVRLAALTR